MLIITACSVFLYGCPATIKVALKNESQQSISVVYPTGFESEIGPGRTKKEHYKLDCIRIKSGDNVHEFRTVMPPDKYFRTGVFSSSINAIFTDDYRLRVYDKDEKDDFMELAKGCENEATRSAPR